MLKAKQQKYVLTFKRPAGTSRGVILEKESWYITISDGTTSGTGEVGFLRGLSCESEHDIETALRKIESLRHPEEFQQLNFNTVPSVQFALEQALRDFENGGQKILFPTDFTKGKKGIPINGLVWMGDKNFMRQQVKEKIDEGFKCIKLKIGAINFEEELQILAAIREQYDENKIEIRADANGAFAPEEAYSKLKQLSEFKLHSIEQPIRRGQTALMRELCETSPVPIALDEELIGIHRRDDKIQLIETIRPQYIILKPSLTGGYAASEEWISVAQKYHAGWWITSALESNIGLNAIAQWTATLETTMPQGLGTGSLYTNNIDSPLEINHAQLFYHPEKKWKNL